MKYSIWLDGTDGKVYYKGAVTNRDIEQVTEQYVSDIMRNFGVYNISKFDASNPKLITFSSPENHSFVWQRER